MKKFKNLNICIFLEKIYIIFFNLSKTQSKTSSPLSKTPTPIYIIKKDPFKQINIINLPHNSCSPSKREFFDSIYGNCKVKTYQKKKWIFQGKIREENINIKILLIGFNENYFEFLKRKEKKISKLINFHFFLYSHLSSFSEKIRTENYQIFIFDV